MDEATKLNQQLMAQETAILSENSALWEKVFMSANKGSTMIEDGSNYGDFLLKTCLLYTSNDRERKNARGRAVCHGGRPRTDEISAGMPRQTF